MKKYMKRMIGIILILVIYYTLVSLTSLMNDVRNFGVIQSGWDVTLPQKYKIVYQSTPENSFRGDGVKYKVLEYSDTDFLNDIELHNNKDELIEIESMNFLDEIAVNHSFRPKFDSSYYWIREVKDDNDVLIIIINLNSRLLYIIESRT